MDNLIICTKEHALSIVLFVIVFLELSLLSQITRLKAYKTASPINLSLYKTVCREKTSALDKRGLSVIGVEY